MKKRYREIISWVVYLVFLAGFVYGTPRMLVRVLDTPHPMAVITSSSMWPALKKGDMVLIKGVDGRGDIEMGDIAVYRNEKGFTIHRVVKMEEDTLTTKGDANNTKDSPVRYEEVVGKAFEVRGRVIRVPFLGKVGMLVNKIVSNI